MASSTEDARPIAEHISITSQVQSMVSTTADLLQMAHLLSPSAAILIVRIEVVLSSLPLLDDVLLCLDLSLLCLLIVLEGEQSLRIVAILQLLPLRILLFLISVKTILIAALLERWHEVRPVFFLTDVVVGLAKPVRCRLVHRVLVLVALILACTLSALVS